MAIEKTTVKSVTHTWKTNIEVYGYKNETQEQEVSVSTFESDLDASSPNYAWGNGLGYSISASRLTPKGLRDFARWLVDVAAEVEPTEHCQPKVKRRKGRKAA